MSEETSEPLVLGRYALYDKIAEGGMATVHVGRLVGPVGFSRTCAIKRLHPELAKDPDFVAMFLDEARLASRVRHPNVVTILDIAATQGELFLVMDFVQGEALSSLYKRVNESGARVPVPILTSILIGVLSGLQAAHEATGEGGQPLNLVHRDVSPQNILVDVDGVARVLDFGVAKAANRLQQTRDGELKGKPAYMAPEQFTAESFDRRADLYAAAAVMWEGLAGRRLLDGNDPIVIMHRASQGLLPQLSSVVPDVQPELDALLTRALALDVERRIPTAQEFATELERVVTPASQRQVAAWLQRTASEDLRRRSDTIRRIESIAFSSSGSGSSDAFDAANLAAAIAVESSNEPVSQRERTPPRTAASGSVGAATSSSTSSFSGTTTARLSSSDVRFDSSGGPPRAEPAGRASRGRTLLVAILVVGVVLAIAFSSFGPRASTAKHPEVAAEAVKVAPAVPPPGMIERPTPAAVASPGLIPNPSEPAITAAVSTAPRQPPRGDARPNASAPSPARSARPPPAPPAPPPSNECANPYYIDEQGLKRIKPGCF